MKTFIHSIFFVVVLCFSAIHLPTQQGLKEGVFIVGESTYEVAKSSNLRMRFW